MTSKKGLTICLVVICISTVYGAVALPNNDQKFLILAYKNFDNSNKVCTSEANWCNYTGNQTKAIIYGYLQKKIKIPEGVDELDVAIQLSSDGWGEGLAVSIDKWTPNSAVRIKIDEDIKETKISKLPDGDPHIHHSSITIPN